MGIEGKSLYLGEQGVVTVDVSPAGLYHSDFFIFEINNRLFEPIRLREEVCIEDSNEITFGNGSTILEGTCLEAFAVFTTDMHYIEACFL